jgi:hypothetical protein
VSWQKAFAEISQESGYGPNEARRRAEDAIMRIEGSLVLSRVLNDSKPFHRALDELGSTLLQLVVELSGLTITSPKTRSTASRSPA